MTQGIPQLLDRAQRLLASNDLRGAHQLCLQVLQQQPNHPHAHYLLALNAFERQQIHKAKTLLNVAISLAPQHVDTVLLSVRVSMLLHQTPNALQQLDAFLNNAALSVFSAQQWDTAGVLYSRMYEQHRALPCFEQAVSKAPENPHYLFNLAACERFLGRFQQATQRLTRCLSLAPNHYAAYRLLSELDGGKASKERVATLKLALKQTNSTSQLLSLCHTLWRDYLALNQPEKAMATLLAGLSAHYRQLNHSIAQDRPLFEAVKTHFDQAYCDTIAPLSSSPAYDDVQPVFVIGMPRSGTTLVERIVCGHSQCASLGELQDWPVVVKRATNDSANAVFNAATIRQASHVDLTAAAAEYVQRVRFYRQRLPEAEQGDVVVDKLPLNFFYAALILKALPSAKIICVRRNAMDVCFSNLKQLFASDFSYYNYSNDVQHCAEYIVEFEQLMRHWQQCLPAQRYTEIRYERLVENSEAESRKLIEFLGLQWQPSCLAFAESRAPVTTASAVQVRQGLHANHVGAWRAFASHLQPAAAVFNTAKLSVE